MAISLHKLIRHRRTVRWDVRVLLAAGLMFVSLFNMWFQTWNIHDQPIILTYPTANALSPRESGLTARGPGPRR